jgi:flagellar biosynthesis protein
VALRYSPDSSAAPEVTARGSGEVAKKILALAREHDIPIREDEDLLELLAGVSLGDEIPVELYQVVAELLTYLYRLNDSMS